MNTRTHAVLYCAVMTCLAGCGFIAEQIKLEYNQPAGVSQIAGANNVSVNVQVSDQRPDKSKVSSKKDMYGIELAAITAEEDIAITIRKAIEQELQARGFQLGSETAQVKIAAEVTRFYNDHKTGLLSGDAVADLIMAVTVNRQHGKQLYSRQIVAQGIESNTQLATGNNAKLALSKALENGMKMIFEDKDFLSALVQSSGAMPVSK
ncbi:MAG TPA: YajG family lipoprotein [Nitrospira sp.]|nr:YajG family lipoprotein [Nitrospira sp.]